MNAARVCFVIYLCKEKKNAQRSFLGVGNMGKRGLESTTSGVMLHGKGHIPKRTEDREKGSIKEGKGRCKTPKWSVSRGRKTVKSKKKTKINKLVQVGKGQ